MVVELSAKCFGRVTHGPSEIMFELGQDWREYGRPCRLAWIEHTMRESGEGSSERQGGKDFRQREQNVQRHHGIFSKLTGIFRTLQNIC